MKNENRAFSWKKIAEIHHKNLILGWKHKPKFRVGEVVVVKPKAQSIYGTVRGEPNQLIAGFDKCRELLRGRQGIIISISHDCKYGVDYYVLFGSKRSGKKPYRKVTMMESWLKKRNDGDEPIVADFRYKRDTEEKYAQRLHSNVCDVMKAGLDCLWLECGIDQYLYDNAKKFAQLMESPGGKLLLEWLNEPDTIKRINKEEKRRKGAKRTSFHYKHVDICEECNAPMKLVKDSSHLVTYECPKCGRIQEIIPPDV